MAKTVLQNRWFRAAYAALLTVLLSALLTAPVKAAADYTITGKYHQSDARSSLSLINDLRSGDTAWYWNEDDTEKLYFTLNGLTYDYGLEKIAMQRAAEIAVFYSHTRPNGERGLDLVIDGVRSYAENIAISTGNMNSAGAFQMWCEENDHHEKQGHRRNMLGEGYTAVGIAQFEFRGVHLFVQEFGYDLSGKSDPGVCDTEKSVNVSVDEGKLKIGASCQYSSFRISYGGTADLPKITVGLKTTGSFADNLCPGLELSESDYTIEWTSENPEIVSVSGSKFTAQAVGSTRLNAKVTNKKDGSYATTGMDVTVEGLDLSNLKLSLPDVTYTGTPVTFNISIKYNGKELVKDTDYELSFENNNAPGVGTVIVKGKGSYTGESRNTFNILGSVATATNTPTPKPTATATNTPTPTPKPTSSPTPKPTSTPKPTNTPKPTSTP
ncbi:MAG: CAP domain-containing protein, partial [Lachnospiraceae bacterium]|nr:CAP domain-containing protein [Lachnospiraceae bacterium]